MIWPAWGYWRKRCFLVDYGKSGVSPPLEQESHESRLATRNVKKKLNKGPNRVEAQFNSKTGRRNRCHLLNSDYRPLPRCPGRSRRSAHPRMWAGRHAGHPRCPGRLSPDHEFVLNDKGVALNVGSFSVSAAVSDGSAPPSEGCLFGRGRCRPCLFQVAAASL